MGRDGTERTPGAAPITLFGKLPSTLDFVRINHSTPEAIALDEWLQASLQQLAQRGASWPAHRIRFLCQPKSCASSIAGILIPSRDRAGRKFPLALFIALPSPRVQADLPGLLLGMERFFGDAERVLEACVTLDRTQCAEQLEMLTGPTQSETVGAIEELSRELERVLAREFLSELFLPTAAPDTGSLVYHAVDAVGSLRTADPERPLVLDCRARKTFDVAVWVALFSSLGSSGRRLNEQIARPSLNLMTSIFWSTDPACGRALLSTGAPSISLPSWLGDERAQSDRLRRLFPAVSTSPHGNATPTRSASALPLDLTLQGLFASLGVALREHVR